MKGLLVYTKEDAEVNRWFSSRLTELFESFGASLKLVIHNDKESFDAEIFTGADFCINRSRFAVVNRELESKGVRCFNNLETVLVANDKYKTYLLCKELGVPVMETCAFSEESLARTEFPCVLKSVSGHGGQEVFWLENPHDIENINLSQNKAYILQKPCSRTGVDMRVYTLGGEIIAGVKRTSAHSFRSNYSLGGKVELCEIVPEQKEIISILQNELCADYVGFDFIVHNGEWVLNEIEDVVGARMLYSLWDGDVAKMYAEYIINTINKKERC